MTTESERTHDGGRALRPRGHEDRASAIFRPSPTMKCWCACEVALTCGTDLKVWKQGSIARMIQPPALFGHELAGVVEAKGSAVNRRRPHRACAWCRRIRLRAMFALYCRKGQPNLCEDLAFQQRRLRGIHSHPRTESSGRTCSKFPIGVPFVDAAMAEPLACVLRGAHEIESHAGDTVVVIGCGPIGLKFIRILSRARSARDRARQAKEPDSGGGASGRGGSIRRCRRSIIPSTLVRQLTEGGRGADAVIEAVGRAKTWQWALQMVRKGGTVNLFGGCPSGTQVNFDPGGAALFRDHDQIHIPSYAAVHARGARHDRARRNSRERLHHRRSSA